tara:strand:- start:2177 stop:3001 length:825 start_codon:yes stop_codon:yes gene_type:complete
MDRRKLKIAVVSDSHLGTFGCRSKELYQYLKSIKPEILILNGDIIDIWQFRKRYFPKYHLKVIQEIFSLASKGTTIYYLTGNHDEMLRKFSNMSLGNIHLLDQLELEVDSKKVWFFHGDVFDASIHGARWLAKLGGWSYDFLILTNHIMNWFLERMGKERFSFSKKIKNSIKQAIKFIGDFEDIAAELAIQKGFDYVVCGHIHQAQIREVKKGDGSCVYMNSGDWIENLSALEYSDQKWSLYYHQRIENLEDDFQIPNADALQKMIISNAAIQS